MKYLLDTNVVSEIRKSRPDPRFQAWFRSVASRDLHLSVLTVGEIRQGVEGLRARDRVRAEVIDTWLDGLIKQFADRILPVDARVAEQWGRINAVRPIPVVDGLLAATAMAASLALVTRNTRDVAGTGVVLVDPFR